MDYHTCSWRRAALVVLVLAVVVVGALAPALASQPTDARSIDPGASSQEKSTPSQEDDTPRLGISSVEAIAPAADGGWWVLESSLDGGGGIVYHYASNWTQTGDPTRVDLAPRASFEPVDLVPARRVPDRARLGEDNAANASGDATTSNGSSGGWWLLDREGVAHRFAANGTDTGDQRRVLGSNRSHRDASGLVALPSADQSAEWGVTSRRGFGISRAAWRPDAGANATVDRQSGGSFAAGVSRRSSRSVWVLSDGYGTSTVSEHRLTGAVGADRRWAANPNLTMSDRPVRTYRLHGIVDSPRDAAVSGNGWVVIDADGQVHRFDAHWRYTGVTHQVGSGDAVASYPGHLIGLGFLLGPITLFFGYVMPGLVALVAGGWQARRERDAGSRDAVLAGLIGTLAVVYGIGKSPYFLRPLVFAEPHLPLVVGIACVVVPLAHIGVRSARIPHFAPVLLAVLYLPTLSVSTALIGAGLRAW